MQYLFRTNLNFKIGLGNFNRSANLACILNKKKSTMVIDRLNNHLKPIKFYTQDLEIKCLYNKTSKFLNELDDAIKFCKLIKKKNESTVIVDDYRLSYKWEKYVSKFCSKIICIDDFLNRNHYADIYINTKPNYIKISDTDFNLIKSGNKKNFIPLLGPNYALLNPEFRKHKKKNNKFCISFYNGGSGSILLYKKIILSLLHSNIKNLRMYLIVGLLSKNLKHAEKTFKNYSNVKIIKDQVNLSNIFSDTNLLISSAGMIVYESAFFNMPTILIKMHKNQETNCVILEQIWDYFLLEKNDLSKTSKIVNLVKLIKLNFKRILKLKSSSKLKIKKNSKNIIKNLK